MQNSRAFFLYKAKRLFTYKMMLIPNLCDHDDILKCIEYATSKTHICRGKIWCLPGSKLSSL
jgi:hypothetical protein